MLSEVNIMLVRASDEERLLSVVCRTIVETGGFRLACVRGREGPLASFSEGVVLTSWTDMVGAFAGDARWHGTPVSMKDLAPVDWRDQALSLGIRSAICLPVGAGVAETLCVFSGEDDAFDAGTAALLGELADDLSYGIRTLQERSMRLAAEAGLRDSEEQLRAMTGAARDAIIIIDGGGRVTFWNAAAERILGWPADEVIGTDVHHLLAPDEAPAAFIRGVAEFMGSGTGPVVGKTIELTARRKDGTDIAVELSVASFQLRDSLFQLGESWHAVGILRDISQRKQDEERLHQMDKMDSLGNMAGGIAHDLKNMLFPVISLTSLTLKELPEGSNRLHRRLEMVLQAAERARGLVEKIHAFSHKDETKREPVNASSLFAETLDLIRPMVPATIAVDERVACGPEDKVAMDAGQFEAVMMNLVSNAIDAMEGKPGRLTITASEVDMDANDLNAQVPAGRYLHIIVADTGKGMDEETLRQIFEPWFSTKGKGKGTGLGLAVVRKIVAEHGGAVTASSVPGKGAVFEIYLPVVGDA